MGVDYWNVNYLRKFTSKTIRKWTYIIGMGDIMNRRSHTYVLKSLDCVDDHKGFEAYCMTPVYMTHPSNLARLHINLRESALLDNFVA